MKKIKLTILASLFVLLWTQLGLAHPPGISDEMNAYIKRDGLMHLIRAERYILQEMLVGKRELDQAEFVRASKSLAAMFSMIPSTFQENAMVDYSRAKPEIWENWEDFVAQATELRMIAEEMAATAEIRGAAAAVEMVRQLNCGSCHNPYRE
jgi:cytochrome c556